MILKRFYHDQVAQASFLIGCAKTGEAVVVDANLDLDVYLAAAEAEDLRITAITETHIHADYVSGSRELARRTGGKLYLSGEGGPDWQYAFAAEEDATLLSDGSEIRIGNVRLRALHTPGHTPEHLAFLVVDGAITDQPVGMISGDFVFVGDVGRPDLLETAAGVANTMESGARSLYRSIQKLRSYSPSLILWPGHGSGSACGKSLGGLPETTLGYELATNWAFLMPDEEAFVKEVLSNQPEPPAYFATMKRVNKAGHLLTPRVPVRWAPSRLSEMGRADWTVVDLRPRPEFESTMIRGSVSIPLNSNFCKWAGSLFSEDQPLVLLARDREEALEATKSLMLVGLHQVLAWIPVSAAFDFARAAGEVAPLPVITPQQALGSGSTLDVRTLAERNDGKIEGSVHVPLARLGLRLAEVPREGQVVVYCQTGPRSSIAASYLLRHGIQAVQVSGGYQAIASAAKRSEPVATG